MSDTRAAPQVVRYSERLWVPWWWWLPGMALAALIALEVNQGVRALPNWVPFAVLLPVAAAVLLWFSKTEVRVVSGGAGDPAAETELWVGDAHLPVSVISRSAEVPRSAKSAATGAPARSGRLCRAPGLGRPDGAGGARRSGRPDAVLAGELSSSGPGVIRAAQSSDTGPRPFQAAQSEQIITPFFSLASRLR